MTNHRLLSGVLLAATALTCAAPASAQRVDRIISFGDSLADTGNALQLLLSNPGVSPAQKAQLQTLYPTGRFSGGTNYIDTLSQILDAPVLNYAVGGAQTGPFNQFTGLPGFTQETAIFLGGTTPPGTIFPANGGFQKGDLLALSVGINDGRAFYTANPTATVAQAQAAALTSVASATTNLNRLVGAGAPTISYVALNAGLTPDVQANPTAQLLGNAFSTSFNTGFQATLAGYAANGVMVHYLDGPAVLANIVANPSRFGISTINCPVPTSTAPGCLINAAGFLFYADGIHPTSDGMRIIARYVATQLTAPLTLQATSDLALDTARQFGRTLTTRMDLGSPRDGDMPEGFGVYLVGDSVSRKLGATDTNDQFKTTSVGATIGAEYGFGSGMVGIAGNWSKPKANFGNDAARTESKSMQVGVYAAAGIAGGFVQGYAGYGKDDHDLSRRGVIDDLEADVDGSHTLAGAKAGYLMPMGVVRVGPVVGLDYARAKVDGYSEEGDAALALNVGSARYSSLRGSLGAEVRGDFAGNGVQVRPYGAAVIEKDFTGDDRTFSFAQQSAPGIVNSFRVEDGSKKAYGRLTAGLSAAILSNVSLNAAVSGTVRKDQGNETSGHVGLRAAF